MKRTTLGAALVWMCAATAPALAIDISLGGTVGAGASTSSGTETGASAGLAGSADMNLSVANRSDIDATASLAATASGSASLASSSELATVIALIESSNWTTTSLANLANIQATAYDVSGWVTSENEATFEAVLDANAEEIANLQVAMAANLALEAWLENSNAQAADVIAVGVAADGSLAVFTN